MLNQQINLYVKGMESESFPIFPIVSPPANFVQQHFS